MKLYDQSYRHFYAIQLDPKDRIYLKGDGACSSKSFVDYIKTRTKKALLEQFGGCLEDAAMYPCEDNHGAMEKILDAYKSKFKSARMVRVSRMTEVSDVDFDGDEKLYCVIGIKDDRRVALCKSRLNINDPESAEELLWCNVFNRSALDGTFGVLCRLWAERGYGYFAEKSKVIDELAKKYGVVGVTITEIG